MSTAQSFPRHSARTQGFTLGAPRNFAVSPGGDFVTFLRSSSGTDRSNALWVLDLGSGRERLVTDPAALLGEDRVSPEEQARRERARERATGITGYATDRAVRNVVFPLSGRLFHVDLTTGTTRELPAQHPVIDPRPSPDGTLVAYHSSGELRVISLDGTGDRELAAPEHEQVNWGVAEFIAAEEMNRHRGYWWSPASSTILAAWVDETPVQTWYLADPANPAQPPKPVRYPAAGTPNAEVGLSLLGLNSSRVDVAWDRESLPYVVSVHWSPHGPPLVAVQSRDQRTQVVLEIDPETGRTTELHRDSDPHWTEIKNGWPAWTPQGRLVRISALGEAYRLVVDGQPWTGPSLQVRAVLDVGDEDILVSGSELDPTEIHLYRVGPDGAERLSQQPGVHAATRAGQTVVMSSSGLGEPGTRVQVLNYTRRIAEIASYAETPPVSPHVTLLTLGERALHSALLLPTDYHEKQGRLPVLLDPYGGPQTQRVLARQHGYLTSQWLADQGFAVLVTDGRGMAGRGPGWERAIAGDLAGSPLEDQIDALHAAAAEHGGLDLNRVAIRGWSFGGYLAALAVLRRPDVFHAAIAGAPVCDWRLYDTHYTERYLGDPNQDPGVYEANSPVYEAAKLSRPMLLVHGTADDNVVLAHSLRLSGALTAAARAHTILPLPGVSHMPTDENTTENLLLLQVEFLRNALRQP